MKRYLGAALTLLLGGCLNTEPLASVFDFDMNVVGENWTPRAANLPAARLPEVGVVGDWLPLPAPLPAARKAVYLAGNNVAGELFLFTQKRFTGLAPNQTFTAAFTVQYATSIHADCPIGTGLTFIKAGASLAELTSEPDNQGILRVSADVGAHAEQGDFTLLGDIRNGLPGCPTPGTFASKTTLTQTQQSTFTTDFDGGFILFVGLHSNVVGPLEFYLIAIRMTIQL